MKFMLVFVFAFGICSALPAKRAQSSVLDLLKDLEDVVEEDGKVLISKIITMLHHVENSVLHVKEIVPKVYEKIHEEADKVLAGLKKVTDEVEELIGKQDALYGFDLLNEITELSGGTKLSTALHVLNLADKAHKVMNDAKEFVPNAEKTLNKMQATIETHAKDFANHILKELSLQDLLESSAVDKIEDLYDMVEKEGHILILDLLRKMEETFDVLKEKLPEEYKRVEKAVEEIREKIHDILGDIEETLVMRSSSILDMAGDMTSGTSLGTTLKVISLVDKFNTVVQDVKNFEPRAKEFLDRSVKKVAEHAQDFFNHAADKLLEF